MSIVLATAKIHILKQFTTVWTAHLYRHHCACYCKDTHFEAIHNVEERMRIRTHIVLATAKIHILKQFTTMKKTQCFSVRLCLLLQRYTFWSNSQPTNLLVLFQDNCACYCKDTHFEAIHNCMKTNFITLEIVLATAKIHILKQFTTLLAIIY